MMKRRFFAEEAVPLYPLAFQPSADVPAWDDTALNEVAGEPLGVERIDCGCKRCGGDDDVERGRRRMCDSQLHSEDNCDVCARRTLA